MGFFFYFYISGKQREQRVIMNIGISSELSDRRNEAFPLKLHGSQRWKGQWHRSALTLLSVQRWIKGSWKWWCVRNNKTDWFVHCRKSYNGGHKPIVSGLFLYHAPLNRYILSLADFMVIYPTLVRQMPMHNCVFPWWYVWHCPCPSLDGEGV